jgi:hypothetical protein
MLGLGGESQVEFPKEGNNLLGESVSVLMNHRWKSDVPFRIGFILLYPVVAWFFYAVLDLPYCLIPITLAWILIFFFMQRLPQEPVEVRIGTIGTFLKYRSGTKVIAYRNLIGLAWLKEFAMISARLYLENGDVIMLVDVHRRIVMDMFSRIRQVRPDFKWDSILGDATNHKRGFIVNIEQMNEEPMMKVLQSSSYERHYWGYRPREQHRRGRIEQAIQEGE